MGIDEERLCYLPFDEYVKKDPEIKKFDADLQRKKYINYEEKRLKLIEEAKNKRKEIIKKRKTSPKFYRSSSTIDIFDYSSPLLEEDQEKFQNIKNHHILELVKLVEYEYKIEHMKKQLQEKRHLIDKKEEEIKKNREREKKEKERMNKYMEMKKKKREENEFMEMLKKQEDREREEIKMKKRVEKMMREKEEERKRKKEEQKIKEKEFKKKIENISNLYQKGIEKQKYEIKMKEEIQKKNFEELKKEKKLENRMKLRKIEDKIFKALNRVDDSSSILMNEIQKKNETIKQIKNQFNEERKHKIKINEIWRKEKNKEILKILKKNDFLIEKKKEDCKQRHDNILKRQKIQEDENKKRMEERHLEQYIKEINCYKTRINNAKIFENNRLEIIKKLNLTQENVLRQKEINERENKEKILENNIKKENIHENLKMQEKSKEFERLRILEEINYKNRRIEQILSQKKQVYTARRKINQTLDKEKKILFDKFNELIDQKSNKSKDQMLSQILNGEMYNSSISKILPQNKSYSYVLKSKSHNKDIDSDENYNDFINDGFFITNKKE